MAKRRNLKKEKALRNQAYAKKFRKRSNSRFGRRSYSSENRSEATHDSDQDNQDMSADAGA